MTKAKKKELVTAVKPQQMQFLAYYTDPNSETFGNARASALKAKFSVKYADDILYKKPKWFMDYMTEFGGDLKRLQLSEKVFDEVLHLDHVEDAIGAFGKIIDKETGKPVRRVNTSIIKEKKDVAKFVSSTIGRGKYSTKIEVVGSFSGSELKEYD